MIETKRQDVNKKIACWRGRLGIFDWIYYGFVKNIFAKFT